MMNCRTIKIKTVNVDCPKQSSLTCAFHSIANVTRLKDTKGVEVISEEESNAIELRAGPLETYMHSIGQCAGTIELNQYINNGGIVISEPVYGGLDYNLRFQDALNKFINYQIDDIPCVVIFKTHTIATYIYRDDPETVIIKFADSDSPLNSIHIDTESAVNSISKYLSQYFQYFRI